MMKRMEKKREFFGLPIMFWGLWVTLLILWMGRFVTSFLSMYLVSDMHVSAGVAGTPQRSASSTALRPMTRSSDSDVNFAARRRAASRGSAILRRSAAFFAL